MTKKMLIILVLAISLYFPVLASAEIIVLKSGKTVEGKLIKKNDKYIKIDFQGVLLPYFLEEIQSIDGYVFNPDKKVEETVISLNYFELGKTTLDKILTDLKSKNNKYVLETGSLHFTIMHKYQDYLDAPYTITLAFEDSLYGYSAKFKLFFTPRSKLLYRVEIETNGDKSKFLEFFERVYKTQPNCSGTCFDWLSKPDTATGECFYNVLLCDSGAYGTRTSLFWTDWDSLYGIAVMEGVAIRMEEMRGKDNISNSSIQIAPASSSYTDEQKKDIKNISRKSGESSSSLENKIDAVSNNSSVVNKQDLIDASKAFYGIEDK